MAVVTRDPVDFTESGRLKRLEALDELLPMLTGVLDVREVFLRISEIASRVLPHDTMALPLLTDDNEHFVIYASGGPVIPPALPLNRIPDPSVLTSTTMYRIIPDMLEDPIEREQPPAKAGLRSALRLRLRLKQRTLGALVFFSRTPGFYQESDVLIGRRIADHVVLALSHGRLAEEAKRAEALRERAKSLAMLDGLLGTLIGVLDIREVFDRISEVAHQVLSHDGMAVVILTDDPNRVRVHALRGYGDVPITTDAANPDPDVVSARWDDRIVDDLQGEAKYAHTIAVKAGMRSSLAVPVRFLGRLQALVNFVSRDVAHFTADDVLVAKRIADHIALALSHERLASEARRSEELRSREAKLEMLDELLATITESGELSDTFDRISAIAKKVLAHDALVLAIMLDDGQHARLYVGSGLNREQPPEIIKVPEDVLSGEHDYHLHEDLRLATTPHNRRALEAGFLSALRVTFQLEGRLAGGMEFVSKQLGTYKHSDVLIARRIANRVALALSRERRTLASVRAEEATERAATLEARVRALTEELDARTGYRRVIGESREWRDVLTQAAKVATTEATVLLLGESGTGKEVVARFLHRASERKNGPFVALNCAALPEHLLEAELFGYERGAFTGAVQSKPGQLEQAAGGTLLLDEVGEMTLPAQAKFLRVLQEREFQRLGGTRVLRTDARVIAATNRDLQRAMEKGSFREDLFYRLNVFAIQLPALRVRRDDILPLSEAFLAEIGRGLGRPPAGISRDARTLLVDYHWPGNVRELRNILERAAILCDGGLITSEHLALTVPSPRPAPSPAAEQPVPAEVAAANEPAPSGIASVERAMIEQALQNARFNKSKAAKELGLTRTQLYVRMKRYGLE